MTYFVRSEWGARPRESRTDLTPGRVEGVAFHWPGEGGPWRSVAAVSAALRGFQTYHMADKGWSDIAYQEAVDQAGNVYELRGLTTRSAANGDEDVNERFGAILLLLSAGENPTPEMVRAVRGRVTRFREHFPQARRLVGHGQIRVGGTACPGPAAQAAINTGLFHPLPQGVTRGENVDEAIAALRHAQGTGRRRRLIDRARRILRRINPL